MKCDNHDEENLPPTITITKRDAGVIVHVKGTKICLNL